MSSTSTTSTADELAVFIAEFNDRVAPDLWDLITELDQGFVRTRTIKSWLYKLGRNDANALLPEELSRVLRSLWNQLDFCDRTAYRPDAQQASQNAPSGLMTLTQVAIRNVELITRLAVPRLAEDLLEAAQWHVENELVRVVDASERCRTTHGHTSSGS